MWPKSCLPVLLYHYHIGSNNNKFHKEHPKVLMVLIGQTTSNSLRRTSFLKTLVVWVILDYTLQEKSIHVPLSPTILYVAPTTWRVKNYVVFGLQLQVLQWANFKSEDRFVIPWPNGIGSFKVWLFSFVLNDKEYIALVVDKEYIALVVDCTICGFFRYFRSNKPKGSRTIARTNLTKNEFL